MGIKVANNAFATLAAGITNSATSITVASGQGARFPTLGAGDYFYATLINTSNQLEIVKCTARSGDVLTVVRAQEGTTARAYDVGDRIEIRITAATFEEATAIADGEVTEAKIATGAVTASKLSSTAITDKLGYTPANKAGDTFTGRVRINGSGFSNSTGLVLNNNGFERVAPEMYSLPMYTYYTGSTYLNKQVRIGQLPANGSTSVLHGRLVRHGDFNYANQVIIIDFFVHVWGAQDTAFSFFGSETSRMGFTGNFASDSSGYVYYHDGMLWEQQTYLYIYDMYNFTFAPVDQNYNGSLPWRGVSSDNSLQYEVTRGT